MEQIKSFTKTPFLNRALEINSKLDSKLKKDVNKIFYNNNNLLLKLLGIMKQYYTENCTLEDYYYNICTKIGKGDKEKGKRIFNNNIEKNANKIHKQLNIYTYTDVQNALLMQILLKSYLGFAFEQIIKNILIANNFVVEQSETLDNTYCIDLLVSYNIEYLKHIKVGLQLKSLSYVDISKYYKQKHLQSFNLATEDSICKDVYYLLHDDNIQLISYNLYVENELRHINLLLSKESICNNSNLTLLGEVVEVIKGEEILVKELLKKIYYIYLVEEDLVDNKFKIYKEMKIKKTFDSDFYNWYNSLNNKSSNKSANLEEHLVLVKDGNL